MTDQAQDQTQVEPQAPTLEELQQQLEAVRAENEKLQTERSQLFSRLDRLEMALIESGLRGRPSGDTPGEPVDDGQQVAASRLAGRPEPEPDFDSMTAKDMVLYVLGKLDERLSAAEQRVNQQIQRVITEAQASRLVDDVSHAIDVYGEEVVTKYQQPVIALMAKNPELSVEEALWLAARRAGESLTPRTGKPAPEMAGGGRLSAAEEGGLPPRGAARPAARKEAPPANFAEAGRRAWQQLGLKL